MANPRNVIVTGFAIADILGNLANPTNRSLPNQLADLQDIRNQQHIEQIQRDNQINSRISADKTSQTWRPGT
jgi:hypothetical protein